MADLQKLRQEIDTDPLALGLAGMSNKDVAVALNTPNRDAPASATALRDYLLTNSFRNSVLYGRVAMLAAHRQLWNGTAFVFPTLPFAASDGPITITQRHVAAAKAMMRLTEADSSKDLTDAVIGADILDPIAGGPSNAQAIGPPDKAAIQALSQNKQTRASELGLGNVREGTVAEARAL